MSLSPRAIAATLATAAVVALPLATLATPADAAPATTSTASSASVSVATSATASPTSKAKKFKNCKALNKKYAHGVGKKGAKDHTSGTKVTNFKVSNSLYKANKRLDRDKDGIACEKL